MPCVFFFQAEDGIRDLVRSRGLGDVYKRQGQVGLGVVGQIVGGVREVVDGLWRDAQEVFEPGLSLIHI